MRVIRRLLPLLLLAAIPSAARAQSYFGQNQVQYTAFDFKIIETEHFDVYYYDSERAAALDAARMAERSYARLSRILDHKFIERKPIILYASHSDWQQSNATGGVSEGEEGVTDALKQRNILPMPGSYKEMEHVLTHEMVHQFQYDTWSHGHAGGNLGTLITLNPPGWFVEGMAEYLSLGPKDPATAMWLRDAALEGNLPTIEQLGYDPRIFPYRYGQALIAYIGERWGDEAVGSILKGTLSSSLEASFRRVTGESFDRLSNEWRDAIQKRFLPEIANRQKARAFASVMLDQKLVGGTYHLAPALSPDGRTVAFFSERNSFFVDLWLADATSGQIIRRLFKSTWSSNYETFRFIYSAVAWSPDGKYLAFVAKRGPRDDLIILDVARNKEIKRIQVPLAAALTPSWSPDGKQIVFSGLDGGLSDLFVVNVDGTGLKRLTNDKYADLTPVWSPDGKTIAFVTDRGPETDFRTLQIGTYKIALYHLDDGSISVLPHMDAGRNTSPQWSPDGQQIAFLSDRSGVSDIFLYDLGDKNVYRITDLYTGATGITPISPAISWAQLADRLAFVYYEKGNFDVYSVLNPRAMKQQPWVDTPNEDAMASLTLVPPSTLARRDSTPLPVDSIRPPVSALANGGSIYRSSEGFRPSSAAPAHDSSAPPAVSVEQLLASDTIALPDTAEFTMKRYHMKFSPDYVARPTVGYTRDNFGRGFYGGTTVVFSDILSNNALILSGYINGSLVEANVLIAYQNVGHRINYGVGLSQTPYFLIGASGYNAGGDSLLTVVNRFIIRQAFGQAIYPFNRFARLEGQLSLTDIQEDSLVVSDEIDPFSGGLTGGEAQQTIHLGTANFAQPSLAYVFDNTIDGYTGPYLGRQSRFQASQTIGDWHISELLGDYRRHDHLVGPFTFATRLLVDNRTGRDASRQLLFLGIPDFVRGYTAGSFYSHECAAGQSGTYTGCAGLDALIGTSMAVGNAELRFPLLNASLGFVPIGFPPIEGALFYDAGEVWGGPTDPVNGKIVTSIGTSIRMNFFGIMILRFDYAFPKQRDINGYWTVSLGPTF